MADSDEYITYAECCLEIARTISDREHRIALRKMAAEWTKIASTSGARKAPSNPQNRVLP